MALRRFDERDTAIVRVAGLGRNQQPNASGKYHYPFTFLLVYFSLKKKRVSLCFTPPENEFGN